MELTSIDTQYGISRYRQWNPPNPQSCSQSAIATLVWSQERKLLSLRPSSRWRAWSDSTYSLFHGGLGAMKASPIWFPHPVSDRVADELGAAIAVWELAGA